MWFQHNGGGTLFSAYPSSARSKSISTRISSLKGSPARTVKLFNFWPLRRSVIKKVCTPSEIASTGTGTPHHPIPLGDVLANRHTADRFAQLRGLDFRLVIGTRISNAQNAFPDTPQTAALRSMSARSSQSSLGSQPIRTRHISTQNTITQRGAVG